MCDIEERIAEVLRGHQKGFFGNEYGNCAACTCDWKGAGWADHAASMVMTELGFHQFWAAQHDDGYIDADYTSQDRSLAEGVLERDPDAKIVTSWVTGWQEASATANPS